MILIIDCGSVKTPFINAMASSLGFEWNVVSLSGLSIINFNLYEAIIISGAPILLTEAEKSNYIKIFSFLNQIEIPVLGICFGHQILGLIYGAQVFLGKEERTSIKVEIKDHSNIFKKFDGTAEFVEDHTEGITCPYNFKVIAASANYPVEAMAHNYRPFFGVQFHPEVSGINGRKLFQNFFNLCP